MQHKNIPKAVCQKYFKLQILIHSTELPLFLQNQVCIEILLNKTWTSYCGKLSLIRIFKPFTSLEQQTLCIHQSIFTQMNLEPTVFLSAYMHTHQYPQRLQHIGLFIKFKELYSQSIIDYVTVQLSPVNFQDSLPSNIDIIFSLKEGAPFCRE